MLESDREILARMERLEGDDDAAGVDGVVEEIKAAVNAGDDARKLYWAGRLALIAGEVVELVSKDIAQNIQMRDAHA